MATNDEQLVSSAKATATEGGFAIRMANVNEKRLLIETWNVQTAPLPLNS